MYLLKAKDFGHEIEEIETDVIRVKKCHHTYYVEGRAAQAWKRSYNTATRKGLLSGFLDAMMVDLGQLPV